MKYAVLGLILSAVPALALAGSAEVVGAKATKTGSTWRIDVTVEHADAGWDHYANGWGVFTESGQRIGFRELLHPHDNEQPFTRSLTGVKIQAGAPAVIIRAVDSVHGTGKAYRLNLP